MFESIFLIQLARCEQNAVRGKNGFILDVEYFRLLPNVVKEGVVKCQLVEHHMSSFRGYCMAIL